MYAILCKIATACRYCLSAYRQFLLCHIVHVWHRVITTSSFLDMSRRRPRHKGGDRDLDRYGSRHWYWGLFTLTVRDATIWLHHREYVRFENLTYQYDIFDIFELKYAVNCVKKIRHFGHPGQTNVRRILHFRHFPGLENPKCYGSPLPKWNVFSRFYCL